MLKSNREEFKDTVQVKITGKWQDGTAFEGYDSIRAIDRRQPGMVAPSIMEECGSSPQR